MADEEVIEEVEYYRDTFKVMYERADRLAKRLRNVPPERVEYDRSRLDSPPRAVQPQEDAPPRAAAPDEDVVTCNCGVPAKLLSGSKNGRAWSGYFCAKPPRDPKNCGFKRWID